MIRSCKIRTRPIVITALALVAGSSVIITDPIFQGMAISLLSGVLVSTVLTLIVIPLGCVAAEKDMCRVALASAPPGSSLPCVTDVLASQPAPRGPSGGVSRFFGKVVEAFILALYAVRGIFILLFDAIKTAVKARSKAPPRSTPRPAAKPSNAASNEAGNEQGDGADPPGERTASERAAPVTTAKVAKSGAGVKKPRTAATKTSGDAAEHAAAKVQKKSPRRGIRLKVDDENESDDR
jgi:hypothetical protein